MIGSDAQRSWSVRVMLGQADAKRRAARIRPKDEKSSDTKSLLRGAHSQNQNNMTSNISL